MNIIGASKLVNFYPQPRGPRVLPTGELVLWYGMFAPRRRLLGTMGFGPCMGFAHGAPFAINCHHMENIFLNIVKGVTFFQRSCYDNMSYISYVESKIFEQIIFISLKVIYRFYYSF